MLNQRGHQDKKTRSGIGELRPPSRTKIRDTLWHITKDITLEPDFSALEMLEAIAKEVREELN